MKSRRKKINDMRTRILIFTLLLVSAMTSAETMRVAILETVDRENKVSYGTKLILRSNLSKAVTNTAGYEAYDRSDMDAIMGEQNFQRTGMVSEDQIKRLGEMTGAKYILVAEAAVIDADNMFITAKLLDVESARTIMTDNLMMGNSAAKIQEGCIELAKRLFRSDFSSSEDADQAKAKSAISLKVTNKPILVHYKSRSEMKKFGHKKRFSYGDLEMNEKEMLIFVGNRCPEAFKKLVNAKQDISAGWAILGCTCFGWVPLYIPLLSAGYAQYNQAIKYFNTHCTEDGE